MLEIKISFAVKRVAEESVVETEKKKPRLEVNVTVYFMMELFFFTRSFKYFLSLFFSWSVVKSL